MRVLCRCGREGLLVSKKNYFYVNHGKETSHIIPVDKPLRISIPSQLVSLIKYPGGDHHIVKHILGMIPPHTVYVEVFGGGAQVLLNKPPSKINVYNDIDENLTLLFRIVRDNLEEFLERARFLIYSRELNKYFYRNLSEIKDPVLKAVALFFLYKSSFNGELGSGLSTSVVNNEAVKIFSTLKKIRRIHKVLKKTIIESLDFRECIRKYDSEKTFFYLDPPHLYAATEMYRDMYECGFTEKDYMDLLNILQSIKGKFLLKQVRHINFVNNWAVENQYYIKCIEHQKSMSLVKETKREVIETCFIANYSLEP